MTLVRCLRSLAFLLLGAVTLHAQSRDAEQPVVSLMLMNDSDRLRVSGAGPIDLSEALRAALPCGHPYSTERHAPDLLSWSCSQSFLLSRERALDLGPLLDALKDRGHNQVSLIVMGPAHGRFEARGQALVQGESFAYGKWSTRQPDSTILIRAGYSPSTAASWTAAFLACLILPLFLLPATARRAREQAQNGDPRGAWWRFASNQTLLLLLYPLAFALLALSPLGELLLYVSDGITQAPAILAAILITGFVLACCWLACRLAATPYRELRGLRASTNFITEALFLSSLSLIAFTAVPWLLKPYPDVPVPYLLGALASWFVTIVYKRHLGMKPVTLAPGRLRAAAEEIAAKAAVPLKDVLILPERGLQMLNAFAVRGNRLWITEGLVKAMPEDEMKALIAHELAHIRLKDVRAIYLHMGVSLVALLAMMFLLDFFEPQNTTFPNNRDLFLLPTFLIAYVFTFARMRQRQEFRADRVGVEINGDAPAYVRGILRVTELNFQPVEFGRLMRLFGTHPSTRTRAIALAHHARIPLDQVEGWIRKLPEPSQPFVTSEPSEAQDPDSSTGGQT
jgi:heat shock protein HtpX